MMHAYPETYLNDAMNNLGNMFDYGLVDLHYDPERFYEQFLTSGVAKQFEQGNPKYVAGLSGPGTCNRSNLSHGRSPTDADAFRRN